MQNTNNRVARQTACVVLKQLNTRYVSDPDIINVGHCLTMILLGVKSKIYDGEFLMAIVDLLNEHGLSMTIGQCISKAVPHFI